MKLSFTLLLLVIVVMGTFTVTAQAPAEKRQTFLSVLKEGQSVSVKEVSGRFEFSTLEGIPVVQSHKVLEVGSDYVIVQDFSGITETHIPIWSFKAFIRVKVPGK